MNLTARHFGYRPDPHDPRDRLHAGRTGMTRLQERRMDRLCGPVRDQGPTSSCVGHACVEAVELLFALEGQGGLRLSPAHAYWLARAQDHFEHEDAGAFIRSCIKALRAVGCCGQTGWPLDPARINERPPMHEEMSGVKYADLTYERVTGGSEGVLDAIQMGRPVVFGTQVGNVFVDHFGDSTIPAPGPSEVLLGGHAVLACAFADFGARVRIQNSWSPMWGDQGFAWISRDWFDSPLTSDVWCLVPREPKGSGSAVHA